MSYCINPKCTHRENPDSAATCQHCGSSLLINERYRIVRPLRPLNAAYPTDIYEVQDWGTGVDDWGTLKVLKVLKYSNNPALVALFQREARVLMWLRSEGVPRVDPDGYFTILVPQNSKQLHCLVMELIEGDNLGQWLEEKGAISAKDALDWLKQIVEILDKVHGQNLLHRDLKPSNLIIRPNGQLAIIDFGTVGNNDGGSTRVGTSGYAAPEQVLGKAMPQSDFFALGRTFVHLLTGRSPIDFPENAKTGELNWRDHAKQVPKALADFIDQLMAPLPKHRPANTRVILAQLQELELTAKRKYFGSYPVHFKWVALLILGMIGLRVLPNPMVNLWQEFLLPTVTKSLDKVGRDKAVLGDFNSANFYLELALKLNPKYGRAHYNLGWVCEERSDFKCAEEQYELLIEDRSDLVVATYAINNLARLKAKAGKNQAAIDLGIEGLQRADQYLKPKNRDEVKYTLYKNLGWALFNQTRYNESETYLKKAIDLDSKRATAYCLLAQVQEAKGDTVNSLVNWKKCLSYPEKLNKSNPEIDLWKNTGCQRLKVEEKSCTELKNGNS